MPINYSHGTQSHMKPVAFRAAGVLLLSLMLAACSPAPISPKPPLDNVPAEVNQLFEALQQAEEQGRGEFAPALFNRINEQYRQALSEVASAPEEARQYALAGLARIPALISSSDATAARLMPVIKARNAATLANAETFFPLQWEAAEAMLVSLTRILEDTPDKQVNEESGILEQRYLAIELDSIKQRILGPAQQAMKLATEREISLQAPRTMALARDHLSKAETTLNQDRTQIAEAESQAQAAIQEVEHAEILTELMKQFPVQNSPVEAALLWHEKQVADAVEPILTQLPFSQGPEAVKGEVQHSLNQILAEKLALRQALTEAESRENNLKLQSAATIESLKLDMEQQVLAAQMETDAEKRRNAENLRRFEFVRELFALNEAEVYQQGQNVLIRAYGFKFDSGSSTIEQDNLPLINKIIDAIEVFPDADLQVSGHTDNRGDALLNQRLSEERAANVGEFIANVGNITKDRIISQGFGSSRPVATNDSADGRAANRRVEVLIINE